jgi:hypothetical protein
MTTPTITTGAGCDGERPVDLTDDHQPIVVLDDGECRARTL